MWGGPGLILPGRGAALQCIQAARGAAQGRAPLPARGGGPCAPPLEMPNKGSANAQPCVCDRGGGHRAGDKGGGEQESPTSAMGQGTSQGWGAPSPGGDDNCSPPPRLENLPAFITAYSNHGFIIPAPNAWRQSPRRCQARPPAVPGWGSGKARGALIRFQSRAKKGKTPGKSRQEERCCEL